MRNPHDIWLKHFGFNDWRELNAQLESAIDHIELAQAEDYEEGSYYQRLENAKQQLKQVISELEND